MTEDQLQPYMEHLVEVFGPSRLLWGSDWPVSTSAIDYQRWLRLCERLIEPLGANAMQQVFGHNALAFYRIDAEELQSRIVR